jgi:hypothetical protein
MKLSTLKKEAPIWALALLLGALLEVSILVVGLAPVLFRMDVTTSTSEGS